MPSPLHRTAKHLHENAAYAARQADVDVQKDGEEHADAGQQGTEAWQASHASRVTRHAPHAGRVTLLLRVVAAQRVTRLVSEH